MKDENEVMEITLKKELKGLKRKREDMRDKHSVGDTVSFEHRGTQHGGVVVDVYRGFYTVKANGEKWDVYDNGHVSSWSGKCEAECTTSAG